MVVVRAAAPWMGVGAGFPRTDKASVVRGRTFEVYKGAIEGAYRADVVEIRCEGVEERDASASSRVLPEGFELASVIRSFSWLVLE